VYEQYDSTVRASTLRRPGGDAGVVRIAETQRGVAATTDCNGRYVYLEPRTGAKIAVAEAARNLVCAGALPLAVTNNLNFGSPLKPAVYYQLREAVLGMAEACSFFETPVTGGNVSLFNETDGRPIYPTPVIGMVGLVEDITRTGRSSFQAEGDTILLLGENSDEIGASEWLYVRHDRVAGAPPAVDLEVERRLQRCVLELVQEGMVQSAHDCAEGGLAIAIAESALGRGDPGIPVFGVEVTLDDPLPPLAVLFGEAQGRVVVSVPAEGAAAVQAAARRHGVPCRPIGTVGKPGDRFRIRLRSAFVETDAATLAGVYFGAIPRIMEAPSGGGES